MSSPAPWFLPGESVSRALPKLDQPPCWRAHRGPRVPGPGGLCSAARSNPSRRRASMLPCWLQLNWPSRSGPIRPAHSRAAWGRRINPGVDPLGTTASHRTSGDRSSHHHRPPGSRQRPVRAHVITPHDALTRAGSAPQSRGGGGCVRAVSSRDRPHPQAAQCASSSSAHRPVGGDEPGLVRGAGPHDPRVPQRPDGRRGRRGAALGRFLGGLGG
jgi:hypothetical protein